METFYANIVNVFDSQINYGAILLQNGRIFQIQLLGEERIGEKYILPGFIDAHVHIESSLLPPTSFARMAVVHGTIGTVSDPHEIANVLGVKGVEYMVENGRKVPFRFCFGSPSCVPATNFETAGSSIDIDETAYLLGMKEIGYLAEMMNFPGVLAGDKQVIAKIELAKAFNKPIDGHAPGLRGATAKKYIDAGISTDHECFTKLEALEKLKLGMKILIREGSAAKNFDELIPLAHEFYENMMFCSDDKHPDSLLEGHINLLVKRAIAKGLDKFKAFRMASVNPALHYRMNVGLLREGDLADFIIVDNLQDLNIIQTYITGELVAEGGQSLIPHQEIEIINHFDCEFVETTDLVINSDDKSSIQVIQAIDGQLITKQKEFSTKIEDGQVVPDLEKDILKIVVINRYKKSKPAIGFIQNFGLTEGAIASSVAHDSHNIIAVGVDDESLKEAINLIIREKGGLSAVSNSKKGILPLPIAGLMSNEDAYELTQNYTSIDEFVKTQLNCPLKSPFMTLSFMALLVIPSLKMSDLGLFDGDRFEFVELLK